MYQPQGDPAADAVAINAAAAASIAASAAYLNQYYPTSSSTPTPGVSGYTPSVVQAPIVAPGALSYYAFSPAAPAAPGQKPQGDVAPPPAEPAVTPKVAEGAIRKLVTVELKNAGFERAEPGMVRQLELEVQAFIQQLYERAHEYANLANRAGAIAPDLLKSCEEFYMPIPELHAVARRSKRKRRKLSSQLSLTTTLLPPPSRSPSPDLLPSDDELSPTPSHHSVITPSTPAIPLTLRTLPPHFPSLPPKHTYMKTPISPPKKAALPSLEKKLKTAGLVQKSLQNLLTATEENTNNEDAELLGHIVNWETGLHPRKRWKVGK